MRGANPSSRPSPTRCRRHSRPSANWRAPRTDETGKLNRIVDAVAGLTAVDGAVVLTDQYDVLALRREDHSTQRALRWWNKSS